jgi:hypothetical protein
LFKVGDSIRDVRERIDRSAIVKASVFGFLDIRQFHRIDLSKNLEKCFPANDSRCCSIRLKSELVEESGIASEHWNYRYEIEEKRPTQNLDPVMKIRTTAATTSAMRGPSNSGARFRATLEYNFRLTNSEAMIGLHSSTEIASCIRAGSINFLDQNSQ